MHQIWLTDYRIVAGQEADVLDGDAATVAVVELDNGVLGIGLVLGRRGNGHRARVEATILLAPVGA